MAFSWTCPFCNHAATIQGYNFSTQRHEFGRGSKHGPQAIDTIVVVCPNQNCKEYTLTVLLHDQKLVDSKRKDLDARKEWQLIPQSEAKVFPNYVPRAILDDYSESCAIRDLSPKAAATLARRCLQGMIRDYWGVKKGRLIDEIEAIQDKVDPVTWSAIDAVRQIGNIGAHMEKDINLIIDVEPQEAGLLIKLIETLINEWYIAREKRKKQMRSIVDMATTKKEVKKAKGA